MAQVVKLLTIDDIARTAGVKPQTVRMWRVRYEDFPEPVRWWSERTLFYQYAVYDWLDRNGKTVNEGVV